MPGDVNDRASEILKAALDLSPEERERLASRHGAAGRVVDRL